MHSMHRQPKINNLSIIRLLQEEGVQVITTPFYEQKELTWTVWSNDVENRILTRVGGGFTFSPKILKDTQLSLASANR